MEHHCIVLSLPPEIWRENVVDALIDVGQTNFVDCRVFSRKVLLFREQNARSFWHFLLSHVCRDFAAIYTLKYAREYIGRASWHHLTCVITPLFETPGCSLQRWLIKRNIAPDEWCLKVASTNNAPIKYLDWLLFYCRVCGIEYGHPYKDYAYWNRDCNYAWSWAIDNKIPFPNRNHFAISLNAHWMIDWTNFSELHLSDAIIANDWDVVRFIIRKYPGYIFPTNRSFFVRLAFRYASYDNFHEFCRLFGAANNIDEIIRTDLGQNRNIWGRCKDAKLFCEIHQKLNRPLINRDSARILLKESTIPVSSYAIDYFEQPVRIPRDVLFNNTYLLHLTTAANCLENLSFLMTVRPDKVIVDDASYAILLREYLHLSRCG